MTKTLKQIVEEGLHDALRDTNPNLCQTLDELIRKGAGVGDILARVEIGMRRQGIDPAQHRLTTEGVRAYVTIEKDRLKGKVANV